jgi:hypothetical protein
MVLGRGALTTLISRRRVLSGCGLCCVVVATTPRYWALVLRLTKKERLLTRLRQASLAFTTLNSVARWGSRTLDPADERTRGPAAKIQWSCRGTSRRFIELLTGEMSSITGETS